MRRESVIDVSHSQSTRFFRHLIRGRDAADALKRAVSLADQLGIYAVEVYALTESAREFYLKFGFSELLDDRFHLYLTVKNIRKLV